MSHRLRTLLVLSTCLGGSLGPLPTAARADGALTYERDVRPILKHHCFHCHGEEEEVSGSLDLRLVRFMARGGETGPALVSGKHAESLLYQRMVSGEMPPGSKKVSPDELNVIARWIDTGAMTLRPEPETVSRDSDFTEEERAHWAFQPVTRPAVPAAGTGWARSPVDHFIADKWTSRRLTAAPETDRYTLIRRLTFDLWGLPPDADRADQFVHDTRPDAYERLVEELLADPRYGERWGRHWLDVAGYADSDGYSAKDLERKWAWKYRDYVVASFNADKPWNEFLQEQLAGDELAGPIQGAPTPRQIELLTATGFLRMGPDGTGDGEVDQNVARNDVIAETIKITSTSLLGLTVGCAQCHNHRYDPISQVDYYRIRSLFEPAYDWQKWKAPNARLISQWSAETRERAAKADRHLQTIQKAREEQLDCIVEDTLQHELEKLPPEIRPLALAARNTAEKDRTAEQKALIKEYPFLNVNRGTVYLYLPDRLTKFNKEWDDRTADAKKLRPADDYIQCLTEPPGQAPVAKLFSRGDHQQPRQEVLPGELAILGSAATIPVDDPEIPTTGRRLAYARHLTNGHHPLVSRVAVNRIWMHHFGRGIVATPGDFGMLGERPTHPELLDWLAHEFVSSGWQMKHLHRLIVTSATYRQSSQRREETEATDPENHWLARMSLRRLEAESVRDAILAACGHLSDKLYGAPVPITPDDVGQIVVGLDNRDSAGRPSGKIGSVGEDGYRRSVYVSVRRSMPLGILEPFDVPIMTPNCERRTSSTVAPQSLLLMNNTFMVQESQVFAQRLETRLKDDIAACVRDVWRATLQRLPGTDEEAVAVNYLQQQLEHFRSQVGSVPAVSKKPAPPSPEVLALGSLCQALMGSNAFLYVD